jgi:hypothetical protein
MDHPTTDVGTDTYVLQEAIQTVYERPDTHGKPEDTFTAIAGLWNEFLVAGGVRDPNLDGEDVANMMVLLKVARNAEGHYHEDNYTDIAGYAENGARLNHDS